MLLRALLFLNPQLVGFGSGFGFSGEEDIFCVQSSSYLNSEHKHLCFLLLLLLSCCCCCLLLCITPSLSLSPTFFLSLSLVFFYPSSPFSLSLSFLPGIFLNFSLPHEFSLWFFFLLLTDI